MRSVTLKSAMTPSFMGRIATMLPGVRPSISLASLTDCFHFAVGLVDCHNRRLIDNDAFTFGEHQRICRT